jgi:hypothetical protein
VSARPPAKDRARERLLPKQKFFAPELELRRCVACNIEVTNENFGDHDEPSALSGDLWCLACADGRKQ